MMNDDTISRREILKGVGAGLATTAAVGRTTASPEAGELLVGIDGQGPARTVAGQATSHVKTIDLGSVRQVVHGRFPEEALDGIRHNPQVEYVEKNEAKFQTLGQTLPWGIDRVDADVVHGSGGTGSGADVAIIDTGIDDDHEDLQANVGAGKAFTECSGSNCNQPWSDDNDHGTHCAGIANAVDNGTGVVGVSTEATLHAVKVLSADGSGTLSDIADGIRYVADQSWDVASMSLGAPSGEQTLKDACQYASENGVLLIAAAGNDGPCSDCVGYPAAYSTVMAVSSTDEDDTLSTFSSTGPEVELAAPGGSVYSSVIGGYDTFSGTSMATPHVSGAAGHLMADGYTNTEARDRLTGTAEDLGLGENEQGSGLLDAEAAVLTGFLVSTDSATDVSETSATLNGTLSDLAGASSAEVSFEYRETGASSWTPTSVQTLSATGSFSQEVSGLSTDTEYEFRAVGEASDSATDTGVVRSFFPSVCVDATDWPSGTGSSGDEHITAMDVDGQVVQSSSDNAYYDYTCPDVVTVQQGGTFDVAMDFDDSGYDGHYGNVYVDWDRNDDWSTATETQIMADVNDDSATYAATVDVPADAATGGTLARIRLSWSSFSDPSATGEYGEVEDVTIYVEDSGGEGAPAVESLSASEVETGDSDAAFDADWSVADTDGDLTGVDLTLSDDTDGETEDSASIGVSGDAASGTTRLAAAGDDGSGTSYTVELVVTDTDGTTTSETTAVSESEDSRGDAAPVVDSYTVTEAGSPNPHAEITADWAVSDPDGDLSEVRVVVEETGDSSTTSVSGSSASGSDEFKIKHGGGSTYDVTLTVTDATGNTTSEIQSVSA
jgi:subtilisin